MGKKDDFHDDFYNEIYKEVSLENLNEVRVDVLNLMDNVTDILRSIQDIRETDYKNTLVLTGLIEDLISKGIVERSDIINKAKELDKNSANMLVNKNNLQ